MVEDEVVGGDVVRTAVRRRHQPISGGQYAVTVLVDVRGKLSGKEEFGFTNLDNKEKILFFLFFSNYTNQMYYTKSIYCPGSGISLMGTC